MIRKHVDLIAIALLLLAITICSHTRRSVMTGLRASKSIGISQYRNYVSAPVPRIRFSLD